MFKFIIIIILLFYSIGIIECDLPIPTITSVKVLYNSSLPVIQVTGSNFYFNDPVYGQWPNLKRISFSNLVYPLPLTIRTDSLLEISLASNEMMRLYLVDSIVTVCGGSQDCSNSSLPLQDTQKFKFNPPPLCNQTQTSWMIDAGTSNITITGFAFSSAPAISFMKDSTSYPSTLTIINSTLAIIMLNNNLTSGINYQVTTFTMNGNDVLSKITQFSFNPPNITSIECKPFNKSEDISCMVNGTSFGKTNNSLTLTVCMTGLGGPCQTEYKIFPNGQGSLIIPTPGELLLRNQSKTVVMNFNGNQSPLFSIMSSNDTITPPPQVSTTTTSTTTTTGNNNNTVIIIDRQVPAGSSTTPNWLIPVIVVIVVVVLIMVALGVVIARPIIIYYRGFCERKKRADEIDKERNQ